MSSRAPRTRLAVFASGEGLTFEALLRARAAHALQADIVLLVSNRSDAGAVLRARAHGVAVLHASLHTHGDADTLDAALVAALTAASVDWIVLAGYLKQLGPKVLTTWSGRILNTHPSLLPRYGGAGMYGRHVHEAVLAAGERLSGASVHLVTADYDTGPVLAQVEVPVLARDNAGLLEARVKDAEQHLLVAVLNDRLRTEVLALASFACPAGYVIQPAMPRHFEMLRDVERAANTMFPPELFTDEGPSVRTLEAHAEGHAARLLWAALDHADRAVGFALARAERGGNGDRDGDSVHLIELDVDPAHGRRGLGAALLRHVAAEATRRGARWLTLTTFSHLPWNAPFYVRHGFVALREDEMPDALAAVFREEARQGLTMRVAMRRRLG